VSSAFKLAAKHLGNKHHCAVGTDALELLETDRFFAARKRRGFVQNHIGAVAFNAFDLFIEQLEATEAPLNLATKVWRQQPSIAGTHIVELL